MFCTPRAGRHRIPGFIGARAVGEARYRRSGMRCHLKIITNTNMAKAQFNGASLSRHIGVDAQFLFYNPNRSLEGIKFQPCAYNVLVERILI